MNISKNKFLILMMGGMLLFSLASCSRDEEPISENPPTDTTDEEDYNNGSNPPDSSDNSGSTSLAMVTDVEVEVTDDDPVKIAINTKGNLRNGCEKLANTDTKFEDKKFVISLYVKEEGEVCTQALVPFDHTEILDTSDYTLAAGTYEVSVNGVKDVFEITTDQVNIDINGNIGLLKGTLEGSLSFPSEQIPRDMRVCAQNLATKDLTCTLDKINDSKYTYGIGYTLKVTPGDYYVYSELLNAENKYDGYKAYYSDFVTCGLKVTCNDHDPIKVTVTAIKTISGVDPIDWYNLE